MPTPTPTQVLFLRGLIRDAERSIDLQPVFSHLPQDDLTMALATRLCAVLDELHEVEMTRPRGGD